MCAAFGASRCAAFYTTAPALFAANMYTYISARRLPQQVLCMDRLLEAVHDAKSQQVITDSVHSQIVRLLQPIHQANHATHQRPPRNPSCVNIPCSFCLKAGIALHSKGEQLKDALRDRRGALPTLTQLLKLGLNPGELYHCGFLANELEPLLREHLQHATGLIQYFGLTRERIFDLADRDIVQLAQLPLSASSYQRAQITIDWLLAHGLQANTLVQLPLTATEAVTALNLTFEHLCKLRFSAGQCHVVGWSYTDVRKALQLTPQQMKTLGIDTESLLLGTTVARRY